MVSMELFYCIHRALRTVFQHLKSPYISTVGTLQLLLLLYLHSAYALKCTFRFGSSTHTNCKMDEPIGLQLEKIHTYLLTELEAKTSDEIERATGISIYGNSEVHMSLTGERSKVVQEKDGRWRWKSKYFLKDREGLFQLLANSPDGIIEKDLYDTYKGIKDDIAKLKRRNIVIQIKNVLYPRDDRLEPETPVDEDVKARMNTLVVPSIFEVSKYLVENNLKAAGAHDTHEVTTVVNPRKRPKRRTNTKRKVRKYKITNTHMEASGIDLHKDYNPGGKDSAFS